MQLLTGMRDRVDGILHDYLGEAVLSHSDTTAHVFLRNEWWPNTPDQLPLTIVGDSGVEETVTPTRQKGRRS